MRIISGRSKGRKLRHDGSAGLRPTSAKVREAVFSILGEMVEGSRFLDLFAGTGAVGVEALSRGAAEVTFVESNTGHTERLKRVLRDFGMEEGAVVVGMDAVSFLRSAQCSYDIIFADPPYNYGRLEEVLEIIYNRDILEGQGTLIVEHSSRRTLPPLVGGLELARQYRYGDTGLSKYVRNK